MLVMRAIDPQGMRRLYLRRLDQRDAVALQGTENANPPFWSPDSHSIGFTANGKRTK